MKILAIDPGTTQSAWVVVDDGSLVGFGYSHNQKVIDVVIDHSECDVLAVEMIASYGMPVGAEVFETCLWIGRFIQCAVEWGDFAKVYRREVKLHLCGQPRAKDGNVRQALLDKFGGKAAAIGKKHAQGPLYGVKGDVWAALAVAVTYSETVARNLPVDHPSSTSILQSVNPSPV